MTTSSKQTQTLQVAIVDDEPLARHKIRTMLDSNDEVNIVGEAADVKSAVTLIDKIKPDLVYLDIRMPDGTGMDVLNAVRHDPDIIFTTAYDSYAIAAFEIGVVDYLVKPFSRGRFEQALHRVFETRRRSYSSVEQIHAASDVTENRQLDRMFVRTRSGTMSVDLEEIEYFQGQGDYVQLFAKNRNHLVRVRLKEFEEKLDGNKFVRIHRSYIVNIKFVSTITPIGNGRYCVGLKSGSEICTSRRGSAVLREYVHRSQHRFTGDR